MGWSVDGCIKLILVFALTLTQQSNIIPLCFAGGAVRLARAMLVMLVGGCWLLVELVLLFGKISKR